MFQFKQFKIKQDYCAAKVGTDAVLIGAWASPEENTKNILDIGTGSGVIALMMAQKCNASITAIDIDQSAYEQAKENSASSLWKDRIEVLNTSLQDFSNKCDKQFDLIVSNPPFFNSVGHAENTSRSIARNTHQLPFEDLAKNAAKLLKQDGQFYVVLPTTEALQFKKIAEAAGLVLTKLLRVQTKPDPAFEKRHLMMFQKSAYLYSEEVLIIESSEHLDYSEAYKELTKDFYLAF
jgi:tRNA1Val (adenine37-N6)-methyltransferase